MCFVLSGKVLQILRLAEIVVKSRLGSKTWWSMASLPHNSDKAWRLLHICSSVVITYTKRRAHDPAQITAELQPPGERRRSRVVYKTRVRTAGVKKGQCPTQFCLWVRRAKSDDQQSLKRLEDATVWEQSSCHSPCTTQVIYTQQCSPGVAASTVSQLERVMKVVALKMREELVRNDDNNNDDDHFCSANSWKALSTLQNTWGVG